MRQLMTLLCIYFFYAMLFNHAVTGSKPTNCRPVPNKPLGESMPDYFWFFFSRSCELSIFYSDDLLFEYRSCRVCDDTGVVDNITPRWHIGYSSSWRRWERSTSTIWSWPASCARLTSTPHRWWLLLRWACTANLFVYLFPAPISLHAPSIGKKLLVPLALQVISLLSLVVCSPLLQCRQPITIYGSVVFV